MWLYLGWFSILLKSPCYTEECKGNQQLYTSGNKFSLSFPLSPPLAFASSLSHSHSTFLFSHLLLAYFLNSFGYYWKKFKAIGNEMKFQDLAGKWSKRAPIIVECLDGVIPFPFIKLHDKYSYCLIFFHLKKLRPKDIKFNTWSWYLYLCLLYIKSPSCFPYHHGEKELDKKIYSFPWLSFHLFLSIFFCSS